jgi:hypothetical protein
MVKVVECFRNDEGRNYVAMRVNFNKQKTGLIGALVATGSSWTLLNANKVDIGLTEEDVKEFHLAKLDIEYPLCFESHSYYKLPVAGLSILDAVGNEIEFYSGYVYVTYEDSSLSAVIGMDYLAGCNIICKSDNIALDIGDLV